MICIYQPDYSKDTDSLLELCRRIGDTFQGALNRSKERRVVIADLGENPNLAMALAEGAALGNYQFLKYRAGRKKEANSLREIAIKSKGLQAAQVRNLQNMVDAVLRARTLVNEPQNFITANNLRKEFVAMGKRSRFQSDGFQ